MKKEFISYEQALALKKLGFDEPCLKLWEKTIMFTLLVEPSEFKKVVSERYVKAPTFSQAINFLYICSNKQIDIELKGSDTHEERIRKIEKGCKDLWNLQNNKSNQ